MHWTWCGQLRKERLLTAGQCERATSKKLKEWCPAKRGHGEGYWTEVGPSWKRKESWRRWGL